MQNLVLHSIALDSSASPPKELCVGRDKANSFDVISYLFIMAVRLQMNDKNGRPTKRKVAVVGVRQSFVSATNNYIMSSVVYRIIHYIRLLV